MESRLTSANTSSTLESSRDQAITWTWLGPDFYQIHFNFLLSAAGIVQVTTTTHHCEDRQIQLLPDFRGNNFSSSEKKSQLICQRSESKLAADAEPPHSKAMSCWHESQISSKSGEELSCSSEKDLAAFSNAYATRRRSNKPSCDTEITGQASKLPLHKGTSLNPPVSKAGFARVRFALAITCVFIFPVDGNMCLSAILYLLVQSNPKP